MRRWLAWSPTIRAGGDRQCVPDPDTPTEDTGAAAEPSRRARAFHGLKAQAGRTASVAVGGVLDHDDAAGTGKSVEESFGVPRKRIATEGVVLYTAGMGLVGLGLFAEELIIGLMGLVVAFRGLYLVYRWAHDVYRDQGAWATVILFGGPVVYTAGGVLITLSVAYGWESIILIGTYVAGVGFSLIVAVLRVACFRWAWWCLLGGGFVTVAAFAAAAATRHSDVAFVVASLLGAVGLAATSLALSSLSVANEEIATVICAGLVGVGGLWIAVAFFSGADPLSLAVPAVIIGLGLIPLSKGLPVWVEDNAWFRLLAVFAVGAGFGVILVLHFSTPNWPILYTVTVIGVAALLAGALVFDQIELAAFLVLGVVLTAVFIDRSEAVAASPNEGAATRTIVALGDSFMSGEGADRFLAGTNRRLVNECRRASTAYAYLVADRLGMQLQSLACSGAAMADVADLPRRTKTNPHPVQVDDIDVAGRDVAAVLISIGGNDAWFGVVGQACFAPGSCAVHRTTVFQNIEAIGQDLANLYRKVKGTVGHDVPVVVMPYPLTLTPEGCDRSPLAVDEHEFVYEFTEVLNRQVRAQAAGAGVNFFEAGIEVFGDYRLCGSDPGEDAVNTVHLNPQEGGVVDRLIPTHWIHGSAHPTPLGHALIADSLTPWLDALISQVDAAAPEDKNLVANPAAGDAQFGFAPATWQVLTRPLGIPRDLACPFNELPVSGTGSAGFPGEQVVLTGLEPGSPVCFSLPSGAWSQSIRADGAGAAGVRLWNLDPRDPTPPVPHQVVISKRAGAWTVQVHEFCELSLACAKDVGAIRDWAGAQVQGTAQTAFVPAALIFVGIWALFVEVRRSTLHHAARSRKRERQSQG